VQRKVHNDLPVTSCNHVFTLNDSWSLIDVNWLGSKY